MKAFRRLISAAALCSLLAACQERLPEADSPVIGEEGVPLELEVIANPAGVTRGPIYDTSLPEGSRIGVAIVENGLDTYDGKNLMNIPYEAKTKDGAQVWEAVNDPILLTHTYGNVYAYYPYSEDITSLREIPLKASSTHQVDYLHAKKVSSKRKNSPKASIYFYHILGVVRLSVTRGSYTEEGVITAASIGGQGVAGKAMLNTIDGLVTDYEDVGVPIGPPIEPFTISSEAQWRDIIVVPSKTVAKAEIELCIDGRMVKVQTAKDVRIDGGYINIINITVDKGSAYVTSTDITEWTHDQFSNRIELKDHTITFGGNTEALTFDSSVDEDGNVNIIVAPQFTKDSEVKPVTIDGNATFHQSVDEDTGIMTIRLSDINSDVTINFNSFWLWLTINFDIRDTQVGVEQKIFGTYTRPERVKMDGIEIDTDNMHTFETAGEHVMRLATANYKDIGSSAFSYITGLKSAIIPEGVQSISSWGFLGTSSMTEISLPSTLKSLGYQVFERTGLISCVFPDGCRMSYGVLDECYELTYAKLPSDMTVIPESMFQGCSKLEKIDLPPGFTDIGERAFSGTAIKSFVIPKEMTTIRWGTFSYCKQLEEVTLPPNLTEIEERAFMYCTALKRVIQADGSYNDGEFFIPEGVTELGEYAIYFDSPSLHTVRLPSTLETVVQKSFVSPMLERFTMNKPNPKFDIRNNSVVETATGILVGGCTQGGTIDESVSIIGPYAFYDSEVERIEFHAGVTEIHDNAFAFSLPKLIISRALVPPTLGTTPFQIANYRGTLKVPEEALSAYRTQWMINEVGYLGWSTARWGLVALSEGE